MEKFRLDVFTIFNLEYTLGCGQVFRWEKIGGWWYGITKDRIFKIRQNGRELIFENIDKAFVQYYFSLDVNLREVLLSISKDEHIKQAIHSFKGLRIVRQDPWECLISYMCATNKNIPGIKQSIEALSQKFGERKTFERKVFYSFPTPARLAKASLTELRGCGVGFRAKYIREAARKAVQGNISFENLREISHKEAKQELLRRARWVADCVLLFSLGKFEAFPVDIWVKRTILKYYGIYFDKGFVKKVLGRRSLSPSEYKLIGEFGRGYFGKNAGYAQEYLFLYERFSQH